MTAAVFLSTRYNHKYEYHHKYPINCLFIEVLLFFSGLLHAGGARREVLEVTLVSFMPGIGCSHIFHIFKVPGPKLFIFPKEV